MLRNLLSRKTPPANPPETQAEVMPPPSQQPMPSPPLQTRTETSQAKAVPETTVSPESPEPDEQAAAETTANEAQDPPQAPIPNSEDGMSKSESNAAKSHDTSTETPANVTRSSGLSGATNMENMSVIGPSLVIKGELEAGENLLIEGRVEGNINHTADSLVIGGNGSVQAEVRAQNVVVEGTVDGDIYGSRSVAIRETAKVCGNVFTPRVSITEGAHFKGNIDMDVESMQKH